MTPITEGILNHDRKSLRSMLSPGSCAQGDTFYAIQMFTMIFIFYILMVGKDCSVTIFMQPIAVNSEKLKFSLKEADILIAVFSTCYTSGRIVMSILGKWVSVKVCILLKFCTI